MLALNSYGLSASRPGPGSNNAERVSLPRLCGGGLPAVREIRSLTKLDLRSEHPLYRTTTGYDYRYLKCKDVALSCPKHARPAGFTKEFIAGAYTDTSLLSLDQSKRRAELWQQKMLARTNQMRVKYDELQQLLEHKKELRRVQRAKRRREMEVLRLAVVQLQARMRGYLTRSMLAHEKFQRATEAARRIQQASRARARVRVAKQVLESKRRARNEVFAAKIQHVCRNFVQRMRARQQLKKLREAKRLKEMEQERVQCQRDAAARQIQSLGRGHIARKDLHRRLSSTESMAYDKDDRDATSGRRSRGARRVIAQMQQVRRKHTRTTVRIPSK
ncbi:hypothetical protein PHMEG_00016340 [Phytophthora megakarya]|uniref:Uncharacterized protein n=1 Tax=Phytophthora megakarya TaxID=4795 RepID=A0A225W0R0_9STRA|nr:hypothetical protein PHMEG_00016340 [Phytophthora megakarya]